MIEIDEAIGQVESLYRALTGKQLSGAETTTYAPIPPERDPVVHVQEQLDRLFRALGEPIPGSRAETARAWTPPISVYESNTEIVVCAELPGATRDKLDVNVQANALIIAGQRSTTIEGTRPVMNERPLGPFRRVVLLPPGLKTSEMNAQLREGVLEIRIPKDATSSANPRAVPVS